MKKVAGSVFRPWDSDHLEPLGHSRIKTELPASPAVVQEEELMKNEEADVEKKEEGVRLRRSSGTGHQPAGQPGLENGLAIAMRGLVGAAGRPAAFRWNLAGCWRGLLTRPRLSAPASSRSHLTPHTGGWSL
jgi:hypothetical protein